MGIKPQIGVLAVQGAFIEHERILKSIGAEVFEIRQLRDLDRHLDGLVLLAAKAPCKENCSTT